jgi:hypothetical protein
MSKTAPAGTEPFVDMFKSNMANANAMYEQFAKAGQTAYDHFQSQLGDMGSHFGVSAKPAKSKKAAAAA